MKADTTNARSYLRPGAGERVFGRILVFLVWIGLIRGHFYVLEVRGRKSGRRISLPVDGNCPIARRPPSASAQMNGHVVAAQTRIKSRSPYWNVTLNPNASR
jgi:hypothetical protein